MAIIDIFIIVYTSRTMTSFSRSSWKQGFIQLKHMKNCKVKTEKVYLRSQILERPSIGEYWNISGVPVLPENVIFMFFRTRWCYSEAYNTGTQKWFSIFQYSCTSIWDLKYTFSASSYKWTQAVIIIATLSPLSSSSMWWIPQQSPKLKAKSDNKNLCFLIYLNLFLLSLVWENCYKNVWNEVSVVAIAYCLRERKYQSLLCQRIPLIEW